MRFAAWMGIVSSGWVLWSSSPAGACTFRRGDANLDSTVDISDPLRILNILFLETAKPDCEDVLDGNDDGSINISDGVFLLGFLFSGGTTAPPAPFPDCGPDETPDALGCAVYASCGGSCLDEEAFSDALVIATETPACILTGGDPILTPLGEVQILPAGSLVPCGDPAVLGWPVELTRASGTLDLDGGNGRVTFEGVIVDLPATVRTVLGTTNCSVDVTFSGEAPFLFEVLPHAGSRVFTRFTEVGLENTVFDVSATGGVACNIGAALAPLVAPLILPYVEEAMDGNLLELSDAIGCRVLCEG